MTTYPMGAGAAVPPGVYPAEHRYEHLHNTVSYGADMGGASAGVAGAVYGYDTGASSGIYSQGPMTQGPLSQSSLSQTSVAGGSGLSQTGMMGGEMALPPTGAGNATSGTSANPNGGGAAPDFDFQSQGDLLSQESYKDYPITQNSQGSRPRTQAF